MKIKEYTRAEFIGRARANCGKRYSYSKVKYSLKGRIKENEEITIVCPKHGDFKLKVSRHLNGSPYSCRECYKEKFPNAKVISTFKIGKVGDKVQLVEKRHSKYRNTDSKNSNLRVIE